MSRMARIDLCDGDCPYCSDFADFCTHPKWGAGFGRKLPDDFGDDNIAEGFPVWCPLEPLPEETGDEPTIEEGDGE